LTGPGLSNALQHLLCELDCAGCQWRLEEHVALGNCWKGNSAIG
jgi:hypothetical protein